MKKLQNLEGAFLYNLKRTLYATMVIILALSIPLLSWIELSHKDQPEKRSEITTDKLATKSTVVLFQKQS